MTVRRAYRCLNTVARVVDQSHRKTLNVPAYASIRPFVSLERGKCRTAVPLVRDPSTKTNISQSPSHVRHLSAVPTPPGAGVRVFVALGSNMGDRLGTIQEACRRMNQHSDIRVLRTSSLWETKAMYVVDQADFLNGVCEVSAP